MQALKNNKKKNNTIFYMNTVEWGLDYCYLPYTSCIRY